MIEGFLTDWSIEITDERDRKIERLAELSRRVSTRVHENRASEWLDYELSLPQLKALVYLMSGPRRMGDLARFLDLSLSSASNLADRLEGKGLAIRDHALDDRRVVTCELTDEGRKVVDRFWRVGKEQIEVLTEHLSDHEFDVVIAAFELLAAPPIREDESPDNENAAAPAE